MKCGCFFRFQREARTDSRTERSHALGRQIFLSQTKTGWMSNPGNPKRHASFGPEGDKGKGNPGSPCGGSLGRWVQAGETGSICRLRPERIAAGRPKMKCDRVSQ